jgi:hypothetical protein
LPAARWGAASCATPSISGALIETALELPVFSNLVVSLPSHGESAPRSADLHACLVRRAPAGFAVEWRDMACPAIVALLERATGRRATRWSRMNASRGIDHADPDRGGRPGRGALL